MHVSNQHSFKKQLLFDMINSKNETVLKQIFENAECKEIHQGENFEILQNSQSLTKDNLKPRFIQYANRIVPASAGVSVIDIWNEIKKWIYKILCESTIEGQVTAQAIIAAIAGGVSSTLGLPIAIVTCLITFVVIYIFKAIGLPDCVSLKKFLA